LPAAGRPSIEITKDGDAVTAALAGDFDMQATCAGRAGEPGGGPGHLVLAGRAAELERDVPFALWVDAFEGRVGPELLVGMDGGQLADLAVALPAVAGAAQAAVERHRVARAVRALLARLAAARPVTVLLDDVQWADPASGDVVIERSGAGGL
jgi:hypothetical protein